MGSCNFMTSSVRMYSWLGAVGTGNCYFPYPILSEISLFELTGVHASCPPRDRYGMLSALASNLHEKRSSEAWLTLTAVPLWLYQRSSFENVPSLALTSPFYLRAQCFILPAAGFIIGRMSIDFWHARISHLSADGLQYNRSSFRVRNFLCSMACSR